MRKNKRHNLTKRNLSLFINKWKKFNSKPTPYWIQTWSQIFSVVLTIIAIFLTIQFSKQKQQIQDMDKVLTELVSQENKLVAISELLNDEVKTIKSNTRPNLILTGLFGLKKIANERYTYEFEYENNGVRTAENFKVETAFVYLGPEDSVLLAFKNSTTLNPSIPPGQKGTISDTLRIIGSNKDPFSYIFIKQMLRFKDPLTKIFTYSDPVYYKHDTKNGVIISTRYANNIEREKIDSLIKNRDASKDIFN